MAGHYRKWSADEVARVRDLAASGVSAARIGVQLTATEKQIRTLAAREAISLCAPKGVKPGTVQKPGLRQARAAERAATQQHLRGISGGRAVPVAQPVAVAQPAPRKAALVPASLVPLRIGLIDLQPGLCRWPLGDVGATDFAFCGLAAAGSYCPGHARLAYRPATPAERRDEKRAKVLA